MWFRGDEVFKHACGIAVTRQNLDRQLWNPDRFPAVWAEPPPPSPPPARRSYDSEAPRRRAGATHKERGDPLRWIAKDRLNTELGFRDVR